MYKIKFIKKERGISWFAPEEKLTVTPDIGNMQLSFYKKTGANGSIILALDNIIFKKDTSYYFPKASSLNNENDIYIDNYNTNCLYGDFYYGHPW